MRPAAARGAMRRAAAATAACALALALLLCAAAAHPPHDRPDDVAAARAPLARRLRRLRRADVA